MLRSSVFILWRKLASLCNWVAVFHCPTRSLAFMAKYPTQQSTRALRIFWISGIVITIVVFSLLAPLPSPILKPPIDSSRKRLLLTDDHHESESHETFRIMVQNSLNSLRIIKIIEKESIENVETKQSNCIAVKPDCSEQPLMLEGRLHLFSWLRKFQKPMFRSIYKDVEHPPHERAWSPSECTSRHSVAIIIPYRNRKVQLRVLLQHLPTILKKQQISYSIFLVEQVGNSTFNKGILMNAAFLTALSRPAHGVVYHCFIFHDVDLLTENDRNMYTCPIYPRHMSVAVDELKYQLPYQELVGGVFAIRTEQFIQLNGYSNLYWGWGGEDDDMGLRVEETLRWKLRPPEAIGRFTSIPHVKATPVLPLRVRRKLKRTAKLRYRCDGLSTVKFKLKQVIERPQFTHIYVDIGPPPVDLNHYLRKYIRYPPINLSWANDG